MLRLQVERAGKIRSEVRFDPQSHIDQRLQFGPVDMQPLHEFRARRELAGGVGAGDLTRRPGFDEHESVAHLQERREGNDAYDLRMHAPRQQFFRL